MAHGNRRFIYLYGGLSLSYGVGNALVFTIIPYRLRQLGFSIEHIGALTSILSIPSFCQFLYSFAVDYWISKRSWMIILSVLVGLNFASFELFSYLPTSHLSLYLAIVLAGQMLSGMIVNCVGGLMAAIPDGAARSTAATWKTAGYLIGNAIGAAAALELALHYSSAAIAGILLILGLIPGCCALALPKSESVLPQHREPFLTETRQLVKDRRFWSTVLLCISPCCAGGAMNLFSALAVDFNANQHDVVMANGTLGTTATVLGSLCGGILCRRFNSYFAYLGCAIALAFIVIIMAICPFNRYNYIIGISCYSFAIGSALTIFAILVLGVIGETGSYASSKYSFFFSCANFPFAYVGYLDSRFHQRYGVITVLLMDAGLNILGLVVLALFARRTNGLYKERA